MPSPKPKLYFAYSLGTLFCIVTGICFFQAYRANQQILKYYTPAPVVEYDSRVEPYKFTDDDFVHPLDMRLASVQLQERIEIITARIAELRAQGDTERAEKLQSRLNTVVTNRAGPYPVDGTRQLHAIGIYDGSNPKVGQIDGHKVGDSVVHITYTGAPLVVFLCAYEPVRWIVKVGEGVQIEKVILSGYYRQQVDGLADGINVEDLNSIGGQSRRIYACDATYVPVATEALQKHAGLLAQTFFVTHEYEGTPFVIGPESPEWTAMMTLPVIEPLYRDAIRDRRAKLAQELVAHPFPDIDCGIGTRLSGGTPSSFAMHSVFGPYAKTMRPVEKSIRQFAVDPRGPSFFSWDRGIVTVDPASGTIAPWPVPGLENHTGDTRLAFDTKRGRLLLWGRELLAVDILQKRAEVLCKGNQDVRAIAYSSANDTIYACCAPYDGNSHNTVSELRTYNHLGAQLSRTNLSVPIPAETLKLSMVEGKLLAIALGGRNGSYEFSSDTNYILDPQTGQLLFACRRKPR